MSALHIGPIEEGRVLLEGDLVFSTVVAGLAEIRMRLLSSDALVLDLQGLDHTDSSALALLLQLVDEAGKQMAKLEFANLPDSLLDVAKLSSAESLLPQA